MFPLHSYSKAILHVDADAFFASCEQAMNPKLRGKPLVCGRERGIVVALSYEAKMLGITRGMPIAYVERQFPHTMIADSDYETYGLFSKRIFEIIRRSTGMVEEYSIDEGFADITGVPHPQRMSHQDIAEHIRATVARELGITVSVGLAPTKVLAKIASSMEKPNGCVVISRRTIANVLRRIPISKVWGIGPATTTHCSQLKIFSAYDLANKESHFISTHFAKPVQEIYHELRGAAVYSVIESQKTNYVSISKTHTFTPLRNNENYVWAELSKNLEAACFRARKFGLAPRELFVMLKTQQCVTHGLKVRLSRPSHLYHELIPSVQKLFHELWNSNVIYRASGVVLAELVPARSLQMGLFDEPLRLLKLQRVYQAVDSLVKKFGNGVVHVASSLPAMAFTKVDVSARNSSIFRPVLSLPFLGTVR